MARSPSQAGAGIADHWRGNAAGPDEWRDRQIRLEGPAVVPLQTGFAHNWQQTTDELISGDAYYPIIGSRGPLAVQTFLSSPETGASSVRTMCYLSIVCARESIYIANPYFVPDPVAIETLIEAKRRGVDVRIMVSGIRNDNWLARHNSVHNEKSNVCFFDASLAEALHEVFHDDLSGCERVTVERFVLVSLAYLVLRCVLQIVVLRCRSRDFNELEIVVLQHELGIL